MLYITQPLSLALAFNLYAADIKQVNAVRDHVFRNGNHIYNYGSNYHSLEVTGRQIGYKSQDAVILLLTNLKANEGKKLLLFIDDKGKATIIFDGKKRLNNGKISSLDGKIDEVFIDGKGKIELNDNLREEFQQDYDNIVSGTNYYIKKEYPQKRQK